MNFIVTGCSSGIGLEILRCLSQDNSHNVIAISRNIQSIAKELGFPSNISVHAMDITSGDFSGLLEKVKSQLGKFNILINNAGLLVNKPFSEQNSDEIRWQFATNVMGPLQLIQSLLPLFAKPAHIVNISSMGGFQGSEKYPGLSVYSASKGALAILSECLAKELNELDISVNCLALGAVNTPMLQRAFPGYSARTEPYEMAKFIVDFSIKGHEFFNGKILPVSLSNP